MNLGKPAGIGQAAGRQVGLDDGLLERGQRLDGPEQPFEPRIVRSACGLHRLGKTRMKIQFLNPHGSTGGGGVTKADEPTRKAISNRLGSKLRALAGPAQAAAPKAVAPPKLSPAKPKAPSTPPPSAEPAAGPEATMQSAWDEFVKYCPPPKWDQEATEKEWFRILAEMFPGRQPDELSPTEWVTMRDQGPGKIIPF